VFHYIHSVDGETLTSAVEEESVQESEEGGYLIVSEILLNCKRKAPVKETFVQCEKPNYCVSF